MVIEYKVDKNVHNMIIWKNCRMVNIFKYLQLNYLWKLCGSLFAYEIIWSDDVWAGMMSLQKRRYFKATMLKEKIWQKLSVRKQRREHNSWYMIQSWSISGQFAIDKMPSPETLLQQMLPQTQRSVPYHT